VFILGSQCVLRLQQHGRELLLGECRFGWHMLLLGCDLRLFGKGQWLGDLRVLRQWWYRHLLRG
jgi:hypothetical protein